MENDSKVADAATYQVTIEAPGEHVLAVLRDLAAYPAWQDDIAEVEVLRLDGHGRPAQARFTFNSMGMKMAMELTLRHDDRSMCWSLLRGDFITGNDAEYTVTDLAGGRTRLALRQELTLKWRMPRSLIRHMIERVIGATMDAVKQRSEQTWMAVQAR